MSLARNQDMEAVIVIGCVVAAGVYLYGYYQKQAKHKGGCCSNCKCSRKTTD